jgi:transcriptional regulator with XRE-family HTH domain
MSFGEQLQAVRRKSGLTQEEFAAQLKVSRQAVSKWESSRGYPEIEKIIYICNRYGVTMDELFADEVPVKKEEPLPETQEPFRDDRTLKKILSDFSSNLSYENKLMIGGILAACGLLVLLTSLQLKGGTDQVMTIVWTAAIILFAVVEAATAGLMWTFSISARAARTSSMVTSVSTVSVLVPAQIFSTIRHSPSALG